MLRFVLFGHSEKNVTTIGEKHDVILLAFVSQADKVNVFLLPFVDIYCIFLH